MSSKNKNLVIALLCVIIAVAIGLTAYTVSARKNADEPNPNVTLVTTPEQKDFEEHPEWTIPETEPVDYGENIALGKETDENGHTQIYMSRNAVDGDRFTYWEGIQNEYPNEITIDLGESMTIGSTRILLNPKAIWGAREQEVEIQISDDNETFTTILAKTKLTFDPMTDNSVYILFDEVVQGQYIRFLFHSNTGAKAGQAAEIEVYAPKK